MEQLFKKSESTETKQPGKLSYLELNNSNMDRIVTDM
jgi:hypothetical protein